MGEGLVRILLALAAVLAFALAGLLAAVLGSLALALFPIVFVSELAVTRSLGRAWASTVDAYRLKGARYG